MAISPSSAERLCTGPELELVKASAASNARKLSPARLRQKIERARKLRDKYRSLARQQRGEARGKRQARSSRPAKGNENTQRKAQLFDETLERFLKARAAVEKSAAAAGAKKTGAKKTGPKKTGAKKTGAKKTGAKKTAAKKTAAKKTAAKKTAAKKTAAKKAAPKQSGAAALKGARRAPGGPTSNRAKSARSHNRASNQRSQKRRDSR
ncbi:MAG TPA: hypothetical protein VK929_10115 [Longimicrobiales bacterium]|nr:hypothetical protein [Longimicrobiales bacterium]